MTFPQRRLASDEIELDRPTEDAPSNFHDSFILERNRSGEALVSVLSRPEGEKFSTVGQSDLPVFGCAHMQIPARGAAQVQLKVVNPQKAAAARSFINEGGDAIGRDFDGYKLIDELRNVASRDNPCCQKRRGKKKNACQNFSHDASD